jgi:hypothetical protein
LWKIGHQFFNTKTPNSSPLTSYSEYIPTADHDDGATTFPHACFHLTDTAHSLFLE